MVWPSSADWNLPPGVSRGLHDYFRSPDIARGYDDAIADTPLLKLDLDFFRAHCPVPGRLLDLGCGTGRLAVPMAQQGFWVVAVDLSVPMLQVLREKADRVGAKVHCLAANIVDLDALADASFDRVACLFSTLGLVGGRDNRQRVLHQVHRLLRPGGTFIFHVHNHWFSLWTRFGRRSLLKNWWRSLWKKENRGDFLMPPHLGVGSITMHLFTRREITRLLRSAGLRPLEIHPVSHHADGRLCCPWFLPRLRCYGYLIAAQKPVLS